MVMIMEKSRPGRGRPPQAIPAENRFGFWLRAQRERLDLTGEELAARIGPSWTQGRVSGYERGSKNPTRPTIRQLAEALAQGGTQQSVDMLYREGQIAAGFVPEGEESLPQSGPTDAELLKHIHAYDGRDPRLLAARGTVEATDKALSAFKRARDMSEAEEPPADL